jgi:hypothetical protein
MAIGCTDKLYPERHQHSDRNPFGFNTQRIWLRRLWDDAGEGGRFRLGIDPAHLADWWNFAPNISTRSVNGLLPSDPATPQPPTYGKLPDWLAQYVNGQVTGNHPISS